MTLSSSSSSSTPDGASPPGPVEEPSTGLRTAGFIAGGVGFAGLVVFGVTAGLLADYNATVVKSCDANKTCNQAGFDAAEAGKTLGPVNAAGLVVGALGLGIGVTLLVLSPSPKSSTSLRVTTAPGVASASCVGTF